MKKILPIVLIMILMLTGIAGAEAPYSVSIKLDDNQTSYETDIIITDGTQFVVNIGPNPVTFTVEGKTDEGLRFTSDTKLEKRDGDLAAEMNDFILAENTTITLNVQDQEIPTATLSWTQLVMDPLYEEIVNKVSAVLAGGEAPESEEREFSVIFNLNAGQPNAANLGFAFMDLDNNGTVELLLGENTEWDNDSVIYDLYTIKDGKRIHVFDGWDRNRYYLAQNGGIINEGSSSAFNSVTAFYYYTEGEIKLMQALIYDSNLDPENPWHLSETSATEFSETDRILDDAEANYILALYPHQQISFEPFEF